MKRQAVRHKLRLVISSKRGGGRCCRSTVAAIFHYRASKKQRERESAQSNGIIESSKCSRTKLPVTLRAFIRGAHRHRKWLRSLFVCASFSLSLGEEGSTGGIFDAGMAAIASFRFTFFFTCSSNARWKMPTRRVGVGVEHPFPWFWQLLSFVSAMEVILGVCYTILQICFLSSYLALFCWL